MPLLAKCAAAAHVRYGVNTSTFEPRVNARTEKRVLGNAVGPVAEHDRRIAAVELDVLAHEYRHRNLDTIMTLHDHFACLDILRSVKRTRPHEVERSQLLVGWVVVVRLGRAGPAGKRHHRAGEPDIGINQRH